MISEIGYRESRELLRDRNIGRLGCCRESMPYVIPVNYFFDGEDIYIHSMPGRKIQIMRANPHVRSASSRRSTIRPSGIE